MLCEALRNESVQLGLGFRLFTVTGVAAPFKVPSNLLQISVQKLANGLSAPESPVSRLKSAFLLQNSSLLKPLSWKNLSKEFWCFSKVSFGTSAG